jgi:GNAT superfamily N-acetyltransferase
MRDELIETGTREGALKGWARYRTGGGTVAQANVTYDGDTDRKVAAYRAAGGDPSPMQAQAINRQLADEFLSEHWDVTVSDIERGYSISHEDYEVTNLTVRVTNASKEAGRPDGWIRVSGTVMSKKPLSKYPTKFDVNSVGDFDRTIYLGERRVVHQSFFLDSGAQGKGIGTALHERSFALYRKMGMAEVNLMANGDVGRYAWALQGFDFADAEGIGAMKDELRAYLKKEYGYFSAAADDKAVGAAIDSMRHSWDVARLQVDGAKLGKEFMLSTSGPHWAGTLKLDPDHVSSKVWTDYLAVQKSKKPQIKEALDLIDQLAIQLQESKSWGRSGNDAPARGEISTASYILGGQNSDKAIIAAAQKQYRSMKAELSGVLNTHMAAFDTGKISAGQLASRLKTDLAAAQRRAFELGLRASGWTSGLQEADEKWLAGARRQEWRYLNSFMEDLANGTLKMSAEDRLGLYKQTVDSFFWAGRVDGMPKETLIYWRLGAAEHCADCLDFAAGSPYTRETLPSTPRAGDSACLSNCLCHLDFDIQGGMEQATRTGPATGGPAGGTTGPAAAATTVGPPTVTVPIGLRLPTAEEKAIVDSLALQATYYRELADKAEGAARAQIVKSRDDSARGLLAYLKTNKLHLPDSWALETAIKGTPVPPEERQKISDSSLLLGTLALVLVIRKKRNEVLERFKECAATKTL